MAVTPRRPTPFVDWSSYKRLSDQPDYWSNWMLDQCVDLLTQQRKSRLADLLRQAREAAPLAVPDDYKGPIRMHRLKLSAADATELYQCIRAAQNAGMTTAQTRTRGLGGFVEVCREYAQYQENDGV